jgi:hypothetical protein
LRALGPGGYLAEVPDAEHRLLQLLAANPAGCNEFLLLAHGFSPTLIAALIKAGLATATSQSTTVDGRGITVTHIKITAPGLLALADGD